MHNLGHGQRAGHGNRTAVCFMRLFCFGVRFRGLQTSEEALFAARVIGERVAVRECFVDPSAAAKGERRHPGLGQMDGCGGFKGLNRHGLAARSAAEALHHFVHALRHFGERHGSLRFFGRGNIRFFGSSLGSFSLIGSFLREIISRARRKERDGR